MEMLATPKTLTEAIRYYSNVQTCIDAVAAPRWDDGKPVCPKRNTAEGKGKEKPDPFGNDNKGATTTANQTRLQGGCEADEEYALGG